MKTFPTAKRISAPERYLPLSKSRAIRIMFLERVNGRTDTANELFELNKTSQQPDDIIAMINACRVWENSPHISTGESGTAFRFLRFFGWKTDCRKSICRSGTANNRPIHMNREIVDWPIHRLLTLDNGTSQWASAATLCGDPTRIENPPYHLAMTYQVIDEWRDCVAQGRPFVIGPDETIKRQADAFVGLCRQQKVTFQARQPEDFPFAHVVMKNMTVQRASELWPSLAGHESNRLTSVSKAWEKWEARSEIDSGDHRVVQAVAMGALKGSSANIIYGSTDHPEVVNKSWPEFWKFLSWVEEVALWQHD